MNGTSPVYERLALMFSHVLILLSKRYVNMYQREFNVEALRSCNANTYVHESCTFRCIFSNCDTCKIIQKTEMP